MAARKKTEEKSTPTTEPLMAGLEESLAFRSEGGAEKLTRTRRNSSGGIERTNRFTNIEEGLIPFHYSTGISNYSNIDVRDAVVLCQKAYYNFAVFRNTIDLMTEFSCSDIFLTGGSKKSRVFFEALFKKINIHDIQEKFFREYYRSGNCFIHRFDAKIQKSDIKNLTKVFGVRGLSSAKNSLLLPSRYIILNPADIQAGGNISFVSSKFYKQLSGYEIERLRNPQTEEDKEVYDSLDQRTKDELAKKNNHTIRILLDPHKTLGVFYKKQDYEPLAVPMGWPVLEAINAKAEMRKMDMAITRTTHQAILLVTMGAEPDKGGVNQKNLEAMQKLFANESVGRVLISDYTTNAKFVIPDIADLLDPKKYEIIDRDINVGLNNILVGGEKYANQQTKVEVFMARLKQGRRTFLTDFLEVEIRRIAKDLGFKNFPKVHFEDIPLKDDYNVHRIYSRLIELGVLTPEEGISALENNRLPDVDSSLESQKKFKRLREEGLYEPLVGGGNKEQAGTPTGGNDKFGRPQGQSGNYTTQRKPGKIGEKQSRAQHYSVSKMVETLSSAQKLEQKVRATLLKKHKLKALTDHQKEIAQEITQIIVANEDKSNWNKVAVVRKYLDKPVDTNPEAIKEIQAIALEHQIETYLASILHASKV
tara:strand:- start:8124 stop:10067 length:1944 start_codon:yes stop_codon:yes gene_type:complete